MNDDKDNIFSIFCIRDKCDYMFEEPMQINLRLEL